MDFWPSLLVEIIGGLVTGVVLAVAAGYFAASQQVRRHDDRVDDLHEDNRRWFRDRDGQLRVDTARILDAHAAPGLSGSSIEKGAVLRAQYGALRQYRDEITTKRRRYQDLRSEDGRMHALIRRRGGGPLKRFELTDAERSILAAWREDLPKDRPISDPTDSDIRRFAVEGDPPG